MQGLKVAIVSRDDSIRASAARAFDAAPPDWVVSLHTTPPGEVDVVVGPDVPEGGGIAFDPAAPERVIAEIRERLAPPRGVVAVTAASRGVGVTSVALHLAAAMASSWSTCVIDLDRSWGGVAGRLGLSEGSRTWADLDGNPMTTRLSSIPVPGNFRVLVAPSSVAPAPPMPEVVGHAAAGFERVIVDLPPGELELPSIEAPCDALVVVVAASSQGVDRAGCFARSLSGFTRVAFVINRLGRGSDVTTSALREELGHPVAIELPHSPSLRDAEDEHRLLTRPWSRWNRRIEALAKSLSTGGGS
jgi:MinD-like ATPase involved in chromosome partitioning or flagellar assembly